MEIQSPLAVRSLSPSSVSDDGDSRSGSQSPSVSIPVNTRKRRAHQLSRINLASASTSTEGSVEVPTPLTSVDAPAGDVKDKRIRLASSSSSISTLSLFGSLNSDYYELNDSTPPSVKISSLSSKNTKIGDGEFETVGDGDECYAVHLPTKTIHHCQILKKDEFIHFLSVMERVESAKDRLTAFEHAELRRLLMPTETRVITGERGLYYIITPDHQESLHTILRTESASATVRPLGSPWTESQSRAIFRQIVQLVAFCHRIGIYLRDFRLQKIVFTDRENDLIRFLHVRNVYVAPLLEDDTVAQVQHCCCPAYTAPEIILQAMKQGANAKPYHAQPADVWSLGILLFVLLTGRYPFHEEKPKMLALRIRQCQFAFKTTDRISRPARILVHSLIRYNPLERPTAEMIAASDWLRETDYKAPPVFNNCRSTVRVFLPVNERGEVSVLPAQAPTHILRHLMLSTASRSANYATRPEIATDVLSFLQRLQRHPNASSRREPKDQVVPDATLKEESDYDALGIEIVRVPAALTQMHITRS
ncbi:Tribbles-like protein 3 [Aphelenchoides besseyi]|nr:Tribbles-like protein 3 [Aphelenchoides besseyi]